MNKEDILSRVQPFDIYSRYISTLKITNSDYSQVLSPFRDETNPSFAIYWEKGTWVDFATGDKGDILDFIQKIENSDFKTALRRLAEIAGISIQEKAKKGKVDRKQKFITKEMFDKYLQNFQTGKPAFIFERWQARKINLKILKDHKIGIQLPWQKVKDPYKFLGGFILPLSFDDKGDITRSRIIYWDNRSGVTIEPDGRFKHIAWNNKPGYDAIGLMGIQRSQFKTSEEIIICEGEEDYFSLISNGFTAVTGLSGANTFKREWAEIFKDKSVIILFDNDGAGDKGSRQAAEILTPSCKSVKIGQWINEKDKYDIGDFFQEGRNIKFLKEIFKNAKIYIPDNKKDIAQEKEKNITAEKRNKLKETFYSIGTKGQTELKQQTVAEYIVNEFKLCTASKSERNIKWYRYGAGYWREISFIAVESMARSVLAIEPTYNQIQAICKSARSIRHIDPDQFNNYPNLINLKNGIYDLENYELVPHSEEYFFNYINPYEYDPGADCPFFHQALIEYSISNPLWISAIFEIIGYCLTGTYEKQKMFWFTGSSGGNGKGTVLRIMEKLVGYALTKPGFDPAKLGGNFYKRDLIGKRLAIAGDLPPFMSNVASIKELSGGDRQSTDIKFGDSIDFVNTAKLVFAMNQMPEFPANENIDPILRRIYLLPFKFQIKNYDINLELKFENELPGIFNEAISGLKRFRNRGDFPDIDIANKEITMWLGNINTFQSFINDKLILDKDATITGAKLWDCYDEYMKDISGLGWRDQKSSQIKDKINLGRALKKKYQQIKIVRKWDSTLSKQGMNYIGIRIADSKKDYESKHYEIEEIEEIEGIEDPF